MFHDRNVAGEQHRVALPGAVAKDRVRGGVNGRSVDENRVHAALQQPLGRFCTQPGMLGEIVVRTLPVLPRGLILPVPSRIDHYKIARADFHLGGFQILRRDVLVRALGHPQHRSLAQEAVGWNFMQVPRAASKVPGGIHVGPRVGEEGHQRNEPLAGPGPQAGFLEIREGGEEWGVMPVLPKEVGRHVPGKRHAQIVDALGHRRPPVLLFLCVVQQRFEP